jgi:PmbA protein
LERLLAKAKKIAEQAEVFWVSSQETPVLFEANRLKQVQSKENTSVALRIIKGGKIGFAAASGLDNMEALIDMAVETSQFGLPVKFQFPSLSHYPQVDVFDPEIEKMMAEKMIELGEELIAKVREYAPEILCDVEVTKGISSTHIINSQGGEASYDKSFFSLGLEGILAQDTDMLFVGDDESSCHSPSGIDILADRVIRQLELAKNKAVVSTRLLPVIFTPHGVAGALLTPIALAFNGKTVLEGVSPLKNKLGRQAFDKKLNLCDDATITYGIGSRPCDDEGMPSQRVSLIGSGVVSNFLYDLQTAALAGTESTGNGERAGGGLQIKPAISSLIIDEGNSSLQAMLEDMKEGLIVEQLIGGGQGDVLSGDFSGNVLLGYKVENGEIVGRVKDTMISGNVYQALKEPVGVGNEARWVNGILRSPYLYCPRISVTAKGR